MARQDRDQRSPARLDGPLRRRYARVMSEKFGKEVRYGQNAAIQPVAGTLLNGALRDWDDVGVWFHTNGTLRYYPWSSILYVQPEYGTQPES